MNIITNILTTIITMMSGILSHVIAYFNELIAYAASKPFTLIMIIVSGTFGAIHGMRLAKARK